MDNDLVKAVEGLCMALDNMLTCLKCGGTGIIRQETWLNGRKAHTESQCTCRDYAQGNVAQARMYVNQFRILDKAYNVD